MKKSLVISVLILIIIAATFLPGCARAGSALNGSGKIIDQNINVAGFNSVNIKGIFEVEVTKADSFKVTISTDDNLLGEGDSLAGT